MKFGKLLRTTAEAQPEWAHAYLDYKVLKKKLKSLKRVGDGNHGVGNDSMPSQPEELRSDGDAGTREGEEGVPSQDTLQLTAEEQEFIDTINEELNKFNNFFMEKEEEHVINLRHCEDRARVLLSKDQVDRDQVQLLTGELTQLHGDMVMLLNWSMLNYAALVKILKKHDKMTGLLIRSEYLANVVKQPFFSTGLMKKLLKKAEGLIRELASKQGESPRLAKQMPVLLAYNASTDPDAHLLHVQRAIEMWKQLRPSVPMAPELPPPEKRLRLQ